MENTLQQNFLCLKETTTVSTAGYTPCFCQKCTEGKLHTPRLPVCYCLDCSKGTPDYKKYIALIASP